MASLPRVPTVLRAGSYRFFIWSHEPPEPAPEADGYNLRDFARIRRIVEANRPELRERWRDFFGN